MPNLTLRNIILNDDVETLSLHPDWYLAEKKEELLSFSKANNAEKVIDFLQKNIHPKSEKIDEEPVNLAIFFSADEFDEIMANDKDMESVA